MRATLFLFGGPCGGSWDVETPWPPPDEISAVDRGGKVSLAPAGDDMPAGADRFRLSTYGIRCNTPGPTREFASYRLVEPATEARAA